MMHIQKFSVQRNRCNRENLFNNQRKFVNQIHSRLIIFLVDTKCLINESFYKLQIVLHNPLLNISQIIMWSYMIRFSNLYRSIVYSLTKGLGAFMIKKIKKYNEFMKIIRSSIHLFLIGIYCFCNIVLSDLRYNVFYKI